MSQPLGTMFRVDSFIRQDNSSDSAIYGIASMDRMNPGIEERLPFFLTSCHALLQTLTMLTSQSHVEGLRQSTTEKCSDSTLYGQYPGPMKAFLAM